MKKIDEGQYVTDARIAKLEDLLNESRNSMNDAHSVSNFLCNFD